MKVHGQRKGTPHHLPIPVRNASVANLFSTKRGTLAWSHIVIETETLLENCPRCGAWPMPAKLPKTNAVRPEIRLRCPQCGYQEGGILRRADRARWFSEPRPQAAE